MVDVVTLGMARSAAARDSRGYARSRGLRPCVTRTAFAPASVSLGGKSNGTDTGGNYRFQHDALVNANNLRLVYSNVLNIAGAESAGENAITIRAAIELSGNFYPVTFGGSREVTIQPGASVMSDPTGFSCGTVAGTNFYTRTYVTVASAGMTWPLGLKAQGNEGRTSGTSETDNTLAGTITATSGAYMYGPSAILGIPETQEPFVVIIGDSIAAGVADAAYQSWLVRALTANSIPYLNLALAGEAPYRWITNPSRYRRVPLLDYATHIISTHGINQISSTLEALTADMQAMWTFLATTGAKVYQTTLTPYTTSTDSWATTANQTVTANESKRTGLNAMIRTVPSPLTGILEIADLAETSRDSGKWKNDGTANKWTSDGIHPGTYGHTTMGTNATALIAATIT